MLTPRFTCSQDDDAVIVSLYVPSIRATEVSILVEGTSFTINVNPYFLRINFPSPVVEDDASSALYDPSSGYMTVKLAKAVKGEQFQDLDMLGKLMAPSTSSPATNRKPMIEVLDGDDEEAKKAWLMQERDTLLDAEKHNWNLPPPLPDTPFSTSLTHPYGFLNLHSGYFPRATDTENEVNTYGEDAERLSEGERWEKMRAHEEEKWDPEHYIADFMDDAMIREILAQDAPFFDLLHEPITFTDDENLIMIQLPQREFLLTPELNRNLYLTIVPILFSTAYDALTTFSEPTSQSAWTISVLAAPFVSLNSLPANCTLLSALVSCYRRALAYPLYRSWALCEGVRREAAQILRKGRRGVGKLLFWTRAVLDAGGPYAAYARVWVDDYLRWVQMHASDETFLSLADELSALHISKVDIGWPLQELEEAAQEMQQGDSDDESDQQEHMLPAPL
ncbi:SHQ1-domain-containing protein [Dacryopinax primogenitus]|uniref:SHQ1-domain-containing protein n=1 Tax=Dacryopinax primogenitus (strain DJM 731) TaxID=1858805 RepID=M5GGM1_DACPD|nr:SHQ1-domain-containing protein [Dacryopinax primogenitus]EJU05728.1 SHQ1-domain-containing protein [Dacryopinax primogenitus]